MQLYFLHLMDIEAISKDNLQQKQNNEVKFTKSTKIIVFINLLNVKHTKYYIYILYLHIFLLSLKGNKFKTEYIYYIKFQSH